MYVIVCTKADFAFAVSMGSHFMSRVGLLYWMAIIYMMRYLKSTLDFKFCLGGKDIALKEFSNSEWAGDAND